MKQFSTWKKFYILLWKSMMNRKRSYIIFLFELLSPILAFLGFAFAVKHYNLYSDTLIEKTRKSPRFDLNGLNSKFNHSTMLCYYPTNGFTKEIIKKVQSKLKLNAKNVLDFKNASKFVEYFTESQGSHSIFLIEFQKLNGSAIPRKFVYLIRPFFENLTWNTDTLIDTNLEQGYNLDLGSNKYVETGFLSLQIALEISFVETVTKKSLPFDIVVQEFPFSQRAIDAKRTTLFNTHLPQLLVYAFLWTLVLIVSKLPIEKSTGIRELMKSTGLSSWLIFISWFLHHLIVCIISSFFIVIILTVPIAKKAIIEYSSFSLIFVILFLFCCSLIAFSLMVTSPFDNGEYSQLMGISLWVILNGYIPRNIKSRNIKMLTSIFPSVAIRNICKQLQFYESEGIGGHWSNIHTLGGDDSNDLKISDVLCMLCISIILFSALALYIEQVYPGKYGVSKPYYFIIYHIPYWNKFVQPNQVESTTNLTSDDLRNIEPPSPNLKPGIRFKQLCKRYGKLRAVDNLSIDIYEGLITVLLGRNGAGKTTTMSILTGMIKATSGTVLIYGEDIKYNMDTVRDTLGYCPQNNVNFEDLNVIDHFVFFGMLKGHNKSKAMEQAISVLNDLNIYDQREKRVNQLSGGMLRRLSLGIALMGNSKILILDEPTSGLDPETRRELWDILIKLKKNRMILITTHFMEEADALADRIAIIDDGRLTCYGSPMFLKKIYGSGYRLTITRNKRLFDEKYPKGNQIISITDVVRRKLNEATLLSSNLNCLTYLLPYEYKSQYSKVLNEIETHKEDLCISHIEMSVTTLEQVFLKAGSFAGKEEKEFEFDLKYSAEQPKEWFKLQLNALIIKRWLDFKRRYLTFLIPMLFGVVLSCVTFHLTYTSTKKESESDKKIDIKLNHYGRTTIYYFINNKTDYFTKIRKNYDRLVEKQSSDAYKVDNVQKKILNNGEENFEFYRKKLIIAAEFLDVKSKKMMNAMLSNPSLHGAIISVNLLCNAILHTLKNEDYSIKSSILPLSGKKSNLQRDEDSESKNNSTIVMVCWATFFPIATIFLLMPFLILPQMENSSKLKQMQLLCGVHPLLYWGVFYILDLVLYLIGIIPIILVFLIYQNATSSFYFNQTSECYAFIMMLVVYGLPGIPCIYLYSYSKHLVDAMTMYFSNLCVIIIYILIKSDILPNKLIYVFDLYPSFGVVHLMFEFCTNGGIKYSWDEIPKDVQVQVCKEDPIPCCDKKFSTGCQQEMISKFGATNEYTKYIMLASTLMYLAILILLDKQYLQKLFETVRLMIYAEKENSEEDDVINREDVELQQERISEILNRELKLQENVTAEYKHDILLVHDLKKSFKSKQVVKDISFSVDAGECFGLLGVNGAGKTTTFRMLTGNLPIMKGECRIISPSGQRLYLTKTPMKYFSNIGYCPQQDIINEVLTGREMLVLFGKLRGLSVGLHKEIETLAKFLAFDDILNRACGNYSGGNKRKLSIAMAVIGVPTIILLDEPTSGVDPISRRAMWNMIKLIQNQKTKPAIVLTSHSMEECEILCHKVAIMKAGEFRCYGTIAQLKTKYAEGFYVTLKLSVSPDAAKQLQMVRGVKSQFNEAYKDSCDLIEEQASLLVYHISDINKKWSEIFQDVEKFQGKFSIIEDYTISETTLEQIFLKVARTD